MPELRPSWRLSFGVATVLLVVFVSGTLVVRRRPDPRLAVVTAFSREFALIMSLLGLWQLVGAAVRTRVDGAMERGRAIHALETAWHLPSERWMQSVVDTVPGLMGAANSATCSLTSTGWRSSFSGCGGATGTCIPGPVW